MVGIYKITNPKGQAYIGLSKNIEKRFQSHKKLQFKGNVKLRESLVEHGGDIIPSRIGGNNTLIITNNTIHYTTVVTL